MYAKEYQAVVSAFDIAPIEKNLSEVHIVYFI